MLSDEDHKAIAFILKTIEEEKLAAKEKEVLIQSLSEREKELVEALERAISVYEYASMTRWERETTVEDRDFCEYVLDKYKA